MATNQASFTGMWINPHSYQIVVMVFFLLISFSEECIGAGRSMDLTEGVYGNVKDEGGSPVADAEVSLFDGFTIQTVKTDSTGEYRISPLPVSPGLFAVIFFAKSGHIPQAVNIKTNAGRTVEYSTVLKKAYGDNTVFLIGAVYTPIRGGKLQFQSGIRSFSKKSRIRLEREGKIIEGETDLDGHFFFEVPAGTYILRREGGREGVEIELSEGGTVIQNLRSGIVLID